MKTGIHYVKYRYRSKYDNPACKMAEMHGKWRVFRNGHLWAPRDYQYYYDTKQDAMDAVAQFEASELKAREDVARMRHAEARERLIEKESASYLVSLSENEMDEVMFALKLRRHQKRTPYPGVVEAVYTRLYAARAKRQGLTPDPSVSCYDNSMRVSIIGRQRW